MGKAHKVARLVPSFLFLLIHAFVLPVSTLKFSEGAVSMLSEVDIFEVPGELQPITLYVEREILRETLGKDFQRWICNPIVDKHCFSEEGNPPSHPIEIDTKISGNSRKKRFLWTALAALVGLGGILDAEITRRTLTTQIEKISESVSDLSTGVHTIGEELVSHIRLDKTWKNDLTSYLHTNFKKQDVLNSQMISEIYNLYTAFNQSWDETRRILEDSRRRTLTLAKLTSMGLTRLADEVSILNSVVDAIIWTELVDGRLPGWVFSIKSFRDAVSNISQSIPGFNSETGLEKLERVLSLIQWTVLSITDQGILLGALVPYAANLGLITKLNVPPMCVPADDGLFYTIQPEKLPLKIEYQGKVWYKDSDFHSACSSDSGLTSCPDPETFPTSRAGLACSRSLFQSDAPDQCFVKVSPCPLHYLVHRSRHTMVVSGEYELEVNGEETYRGTSVAYAIPLMIQDKLAFKTIEGKSILLVHPTFAHEIFRLSPISLTGTWDFSEGTPWAGKHFGPPVLTLPEFDEPPKFDEGVTMIRTEDALVQVDRAKVKAESVLNWARSPDTLSIILWTVLGVLSFLLIFVALLLCIKSQKKIPTAPPAYSAAET